MLFQGRAGAHDARILLDTGASGCLISKAFVEQHKLPISGQHREVTLADGSVSAIDGSSTVNVALGHYRDKGVQCAVMPMSTAYDVILGDPWLKAHRALLSICDDTPTVTLHNGKRCYVIRCGAAVIGQPKDSCNTLCSAVEFNETRAQEGSRIFVVLVNKQQTCDHVAAVGPAPGGGKMTPDLTALHKLLHEFEDILVNDLPGGVPGDRPETGEVIPLQPGSRPVFRRPYRLSPAEKTEVTRTIEELLAKGFIKPSKSPYGSPVLFVAKKDGSLRMCIDYRGLNKQTVSNKYPLPRIDDMLEKLAGAKVFSSIDLASGYHQLRLPESDVPKTAFCTPSGLYEFLVLPFGLTNAPAIFQHKMDEIFRTHADHISVYMDDLLVFSKNHHDHIQHLRSVLSLLRKHRLYAKPKKCEWLKPELAFLGHIIGADGIKVDPGKIAVVKAHPVPKTLTELRQFLGLTNYFRKFIQGYAQRVLPLLALLKKDAPFTWTEERQHAFEQLKLDLTTAPVLAMPDFSKPWELVSDACKKSIGAVLLQQGRPVAFCARSLQPAELNYHTTDQELLGCIYALQQWRCFLEGVPKDMFTLVTDHNPLVHLQDQPDLSRRQARWSEYMQRFTFTWQYRPGRLNVADAISRLPQLSDPQQVAAVTLGNQGAHRCAPDYLEGLSGRLKAGYAADPWFAKQSNVSSLMLVNDLYWHEGRVVVPDHDDLRIEVMYMHHNPPYMGHMGMDITHKQLTAHYWWPSSEADVRQYVRTCATCQTNKPKHKKPAGLLQPLPVPDDFWQSIGMDLITQLPQTEKGHTAICVFQDRLSKMVHFAATNDTLDAVGYVNLFMENVFRLHGLPRDIVSDRDPRLTADFSRELYASLGVQQRFSTAFHPQTDGQVERSNQVLECMLRHYVGPNLDDWDEHLALCEFAVNSAYHQAVKASPFQLLYGKNPRIPTSAAPPASVVRDRKSGKVSVSKTLGRASDAVQHARQCMTRAQQRYKAYADQHRRDQEFQIGDRVLINTKFLRKGPGRSLMPRFIGPHQVVKKIGQVAYELKLPATMRCHDVFHVSLLEPYNESGRCQPPPKTLMMDGSEEFEVREVLEHRTVSKGRKRVNEYLVSWDGYDPTHDEWMLESDLTNARDRIKEYWALRRA